jgi:hypothetical protein
MTTPPRQPAPASRPAATALLARLTSRGYTPVSRALTGYRENWPGVGGPAGSDRAVRVVTHPGDAGGPRSTGSSRRPPGRRSPESGCPPARPRP